MAEKCSRFKQILEREDSKFEEAMRDQVGTILQSASCLNNLKSLKCLSRLVLSPNKGK